MKKQILIFVISLSSTIAYAQITWGNNGNTNAPVMYTSLGNTSLSLGAGLNPKERVENNGSFYVNGEGNGYIVDAAGLKRVGLMKYQGYNTLLSRVSGMDFGIARLGSSDIKSSSGLTYDFYVAASGKIGIGTTSPGSKLEVIDGNSNAAYLPVLNLKSTNWSCDQSMGIEFWNGVNRTAATAKIISFMDGCSTGGEGLRFETVTAGQSATSPKLVIRNNGYSGFGTSSPLAKLHVVGDILRETFRVYANGNTTNYLNFWQADGGSGIDPIGTGKLYLGYDQATEVFIGGNNYSGKLRIGNTSGQTTNTDALLSVKGKIVCQEVVVTIANWADYVFAKDYKLKNLNSLQNYINKNHHLPNVPSAKEIDEKGVDLGEMSKIQMEKIEELTLYILELKKEIDELKKNKK